MFTSSASVRDGAPTSGERLSVSEKPQRDLRNLFPDISDAELNEVTETLHGYCAAIWRIHERLKREQPDIIDELMRNRTMSGKVDSPNKTE